MGASCAATCWGAAPLAARSRMRAVLSAPAPMTFCPSCRTSVSIVLSVVLELAIYGEGRVESTRLHRKTYLGPAATQHRGVKLHEGLALARSRLRNIIDADFGVPGRHGQIIACGRPRQVRDAVLGPVGERDVFRQALRQARHLPIFPATAEKGGPLFNLRGFALPRTLSLLSQSTSASCRQLGVTSVSSLTWRCSPAGQGCPYKDTKRFCFHFFLHHVGFGRAPQPTGTTTSIASQRAKRAPHATGPDPRPVLEMH
ncbi:hypothetical protein VTN02DRAFT_5460 [Thermoascus thermophilus]